MRLLTACAAAALVMGAGAANAANAATPEVEVKDAVARVTVIPEARSDIKVEVLTPHPGLPLEVRTFNGKTIVDGDLDRKIKNCTSRNGRIAVHVSGVGEVAFDQMPHVVIRTPRDVDVEAGGAVFGSVGKSANLELSNAGCGDWTIANVEGKLKINQAGSGDTHAGSAGQAAIRAAGSGDVRVQAVRGPLDVDVAGSGDVWVASVTGALDVKVAGSGDVTIADGEAGAMVVTIAGSGDVDFGGAAQTLKARIAGSGDVRAKAVKGAISKAIVGSGGVSIGR